MALFYTVDRAGMLKPDLILGLERYDDIDPVVLQGHLDSLFPNGITKHGEQYLAQGDSTLQLASPAIELIWENVRRARFSSAPSRFQSTFATEGIDSARRFRDEYGQGVGSIWTVEATISFEADMTLLHTGPSALVTSYCADLYWSQRQNPQCHPIWESLLTPPVRVIERIE
ncbi:hypothetical protein [Rhodococcoides fascians]|uniref:DUF2441 domain-containing protein n=1 Tax=Rhodococcoides fascians TaxID=1828 RepID=A0A143QEH3_RHOFA|nr:hypothetical protein [Rhodococcus fascians]AMY21470.1 hypothetical protein A3Q41_00145 [Rhodococcus fascians]KMJ50999.1 hypothetical protein ACG96_00105 [Rhodococcus fascians]NIL86051.1 hypothetical protein [Rhodococcus fascians]OZC41716.1 hypothetical protein CHX23_03765 [Rhodococcus fascians]